MKRSQSTGTKITEALPAVIALILLIGIWQGACSLGIIPGYLLPSPVQVVEALVGDAALLLSHSRVTLTEAFIGLVSGVLLGILFAILMDGFHWLYRALYPLLVITQTIPTVAIAPLLVLWFGYEMTPKIVLIVIVTFFPVTIGLLNGFGTVDPDEVTLMRSMGARRGQIFFYLKWPSALPQFFAALRIAVAYSVVGAVISEWLGGFMGLGVYMTRVRKAFAFDKMFAVIILISLISLLLMKVVDMAQKRAMPYLSIREEKYNA